MVRLLNKRFTPIFRLLKILPALNSLFEVIHDNFFGLFDRVSELANFAAIFRVIIPARDPTVNFGLEHEEC